jgi:kinetochore protein Mis13/DSN1
VLLLKKEQEAVIRMLAERKIDLSLYTPEASGSGSGIQETLKENDQNVTNRNWEITYGNDIQRWEFDR